MAEIGYHSGQCSCPLDLPMQNELEALLLTSVQQPLNSEEVEPQTNILKTAPAMNIPVRKSPTFSVIGRLKGSGLIVTVPLSASFNTPADIVVFIGTPNLLKSTTEQMCPSETVGSTFSNYHPPHLHSKGAVICTSHHVR